MRWIDWPIGSGRDFCGVYDRIEKRALLFSGGDHGSIKVEQRDVEGAIDSAEIREAMGDFHADVVEQERAAFGPQGPTTFTP